MKHFRMHGTVAFNMQEIKINSHYFNSLSHLVQFMKSLEKGTSMEQCGDTRDTKWKVDDKPFISLDSFPEDHIST